MMQKIKFLTVLLLLLKHYSYSQTIGEINFPYNNDYAFSLEGEKVTYDQYNFPEKTEKVKVHYDIKNYQQAKSGYIMDFIVTYYKEDGTTEGEPFTSWLTLSSKGMSWGRYKNGKVDKKTATNAIRLPLVVGSGWKTVFSEKKVTMTCFSTDTIIDTYKGKVHAFGIRYIMPIQDSKEVLIYLNLEEYYCQYWGKIHTRQVTYALLKAKNKTIRLNEEIMTISESNLSDEYLGKVNFVKD